MPENTPVFISKMLLDFPPGWIEVDEKGYILVFTWREPDGFLDDPKNMEVWGIPTLLHFYPELAAFVERKVPGSYLCRTDDGWHEGRLS